MLRWREHMEEYEEWGHRAPVHRCIESNRASWSMRKIMSVRSRWMQLLYLEVRDFILSFQSIEGGELVPCSATPPKASSKPIRESIRYGVR
jgi:hypothetical protein